MQKCIALRVPFCELIYKSAETSLHRHWHSPEIRTLIGIHSLISFQGSEKKILLTFACCSFPIGMENTCMLNINRNRFAHLCRKKREGFRFSMKWGFMSESQYSLIYNLLFCHFEFIHDCSKNHIIFSWPEKKTRRRNNPWDWTSKPCHTNNRLQYDFIFIFFWFKRKYTLSIWNKIENIQNGVCIRCVTWWFCRWN